MDAELAAEVAELALLAATESGDATADTEVGLSGAAGKAEGSTLLTGRAAEERLLPPPPAPKCAKATADAAGNEAGATVTPKLPKFNPPPAAPKMACPFAESELPSTCRF